MNLSTSCKDDDDDDCFLDVDGYLLKQLSMESVEKAEKGRLSVCMISMFATVRISGCVWRERKKEGEMGGEEGGRETERKKERLQ